jgi:glycosyltransferase involved in cell wall biosynthesis
MKSTDSSVAAIIYIPEKPNSVRHADALRPLGNSTVIGETMRRLRRGLGHVASKFVVLGHDDGFSKCIATEVKQPQFDHVVIDSGKNTESASGLMQALVFLAQDEPALDHFLVFSEICAFPDCELAQLLLDQHLEHKNDCTVADYPFGLVPVAFRVAALSDCARLELPQGATNVSSIVELHCQQMRLLSRGSPRHLGNQAPKVETFPVAPVPPSVSASLPLRMSVLDRHTWLAAQRVQSSSVSDSLDSAPARAFKRELLPLIEAPRPADSSARSLAGLQPATILFSSVRTAYSGPEQCLFELIAGMDRTRFRPVLALAADCMLAERVRELGIDVEILDFQFDRCLPEGLKCCHAILEKHDVRLAHLDTYPNAALIMAAYHRGIPVVGHLRTPITEDIPDVAYCVDRFITVSEFIAESLRKTYVNPDRIRVVYDGVETRRFADLRHYHSKKDAADAFKVVMVARINPWKRQDLLIQALALLRNSGTRINAFLFGDTDPGVEKYSAHLNALIRDHQIESCITFCGFEANLNRIYRLADALVVCNPGEPLGTCTLEALASGLPVIAPDSGGSCEIVRHEVEGLLFPADKAEGLAAQLARLAGDHSLYRSLGAAAVQRAESMDIACHVARVQDVYEELLSAKTKVQAQAHLWPPCGSSDLYRDLIQPSNPEVSRAQGRG